MRAALHAQGTPGPGGGGPDSLAWEGGQVTRSGPMRLRVFKFREVGRPTVQNPGSRLPGTLGKPKIGLETDWPVSRPQLEELRSRSVQTPSWAAS